MVGCDMFGYEFGGGVADTCVVGNDVRKMEIMPVVDDTPCRGERNRVQSDAVDLTTNLTRSITKKIILIIYA